MNCEKYLHLLDDLVEGELDEPTREQVDLHIFACSECASHFERLKKEKQLYSRYLFEIEPPKALWVKFQNKLEADQQQTILAAQKSFPVFEWTAKILGFLRLDPALTIAGALVLFAVGVGFFFSFFADERGVENGGLAPIQVMLPGIPENGALFTPSGNQNNDLAKDKGKAENSKNKAPNPSSKPFAIKQKETIKTQPKKDISAEFTYLAKEEQMQILEIKALETETAQQMEKIELLLRSFRNARLAEGSEQFDIAYEKQQARKLLAKNIELRQKSESYGTLFTEEMLSRVEPYLLDIANLDSNPSLAQVLEIKERVKNQNIIASLQSF